MTPFEDFLKLSLILYLQDFVNSSTFGVSSLKSNSSQSNQPFSVPSESMLLKVNGNMKGNEFEEGEISSDLDVTEEICQVLI